MDLRVRWQPKQREAWALWDDRSTTRLGIGGARGGSKSGFLRRGILCRRWKYPKSTGLLLRRTLPDLERSHLLKLFEEFPELRPYFHEQKKMLALPNGSVQFFASAPTPKDIAKQYSAEFADIALDEAQEFSQSEIEQLSGSNRCTSNLDIVPKMLFSFMPGVSSSGIPPVGLPYLKRIFVDGELRGEERLRDWKRVQVYAWDNVEWARVPLLQDHVSDAEFYSWDNDKRRDYFITRTEFGAQLSALTNEALRNAWLFGSWDTFEGQFFNNFSFDKHTATGGDVASQLKPWHKYWISGDWGFDHPYCYHLHAQTETGHVYTVKEIWGREAGESEHGRQIGEMCKSLNIAAFPLSWDAFGKLGRMTPRAITELIADALPPNVPRPVPADAAPGSRVSGWRLMHQLLDANLWTISRECVKLIECLPSLVRDMKRNTEDVLKVDWSENHIGDDPADSARYGLQYMLGGVVLPVEERVKARVHTDDPLSNFIWTKKFTEEEKRKTPFVKKPHRFHPRGRFH